MLCLLGIHRYKLIKGTHNKYYECKTCGCRKIFIPAKGHQPIDKNWIDDEMPGKATPNFIGKTWRKKNDSKTKRKKS